MIASLAVLALATLLRLGELALARRNTRRLLARGATESGAEHYPLILGLNAAWLAGLWLLGWDRPVIVFWLLVYLILQGLRAWILLSLGERWTTRIITVAGEPLVRRGPYRWLPHPNYMLIAAEIAVLPLVFGLAAYALVFFLLNASLLWVRIRAENAALKLSEEPADEGPPPA
ncbi:MAG: isoprenylcysteine carboxylmethyltransferase family protein [Phenylobacterium sp.]